MSQILTDRLHVLISPEEIAQIDGWRRPLGIDSRGAAVRKLIQRGLRPATRDVEQIPAATEKAPLVTPAAHAPKAARPQGGWPWEADELRNATRALNVDVPAALKVKLDWLQRKREEGSRRKMPQKEMVAAAIEAYVSAELRRFGLEV